MSGYNYSPLRNPGYGLTGSSGNLTYSASPEADAPKEICEAATNIFKVIALEECDIERLRQLFASMREFTSNKEELFNHLATGKDEKKVTAEKLKQFMLDNKSKDITTKVIEGIIQEFDSS